MGKLTSTIMCLLVACSTFGQESKWLSNKEGKWRFENHLPDKAYNLRNSSLSASENQTYKNKITDLALWFQQNHPMLKTPQGYDLRALTTWVWGDFTTKQEWEYAIPASMGFLFELFHSDGGKWTVEPPQYNFDINNILVGHEGLYFTPETIVEDGKRYDLSQSEAVAQALRNIQKYFHVAPLIEQPCPGVNVYEIFPGDRRKIVVFNPERPPFWIPVTVKEMAEAHLAYYSLFQKIEIDKMLLDQLKQEIAELTSEELAAPAYAGHDTHFVLKVNGQGKGLQLMRFNSDYWNRNLPISSIQFITFWDPFHTEEQMAEQQKRSYSDYPQLFVNKMNWCEVAKRIEK